MKAAACFALAPVVVCLDNNPPFDWTFGADGALHLSLGSVFHALNTDGSPKWTFNTASRIAAHKEGSNGTIHIITQSSKTNRMLYALDGTDGSLRWQETSQDRGPCYVEEIRLLVSHSTVYTTCRGPADPLRSKRIEATGVDGASRWMEVVANLTQMDVSPDGGVLVQTDAEYRDHRPYPPPGHLHDSSLFALHPDSGDLKWTLHMDGLAGEAQWALSANDVFIAPIPDKAPLAVNLIHLHGDNGNVFWNSSYNVPNPEIRYGSRVIPSVKPIFGCNGEVYVTNLKDEDGICRTYALDFTGSTLRKLPCFEDDFQHSTLQNEDGTEEDIFVTRAHDFAAHQTNVVTYSGTTGRLLWNASIAGEFNLNKIGPDGTVLILEQPHNQEVVAIRNGYEVWRTNNGAPFFEAALMAKDGTTYLLRPIPFDSWGEVVALDANGTQKWSYHLSDASAQTAQLSLAVV